MKLYFTGNQPRLPETDPRRDRTAGMPRLPSHLLERHRARALRPGDAPLASGSAAPNGTVYRYSRLMMCHQLLQNREQLDELDAAMSVQGIQVDRSGLGGKDLSPRFHRASLKLGERAAPAALDAWQVLQNIRGAAAGGRCSSDILGRMRLEHLLIGSALQGAGAMFATDDEGWPGGGVPDPGNYIFQNYSGRLPVDIAVPMPIRRPLSQIPGGRRPVVAVLDSGVAPEHPAFEISERQENADTFITVDSQLQDVLRGEADQEAPIIDGPWDSVTTDDSLTGEVASHYGHGTFIAGLIRQIAPDAQVRSIRVMQNDGVVYEHECLGALTALAEEVERARNGDDTAQPVDAVCLSFGYVDESPDDQVSGGLQAVVQRLTALGVPVIAAAGNGASTRPFYPAAFAAEPRPQQAAPVISVGALNPSGSVAMFSNGGPWVSCFATGAALVSTYPSGVNGSDNPGRTSHLGDRMRESFDPDNFGAGYAIWSGTSFSAPVVAAKLAAALVENAEIAELAPHDAPAVTHRVQSAIKAIGG